MTITDIRDLPDNDQYLRKAELYEIYKALWENMKRENELVNYRITWLITTSAAILLTESFIAGRIFTDNSTKISSLAGVIYSLILLFMTIAAFIFTRFSMIGVAAAQEQIGVLQEHYHSFSKREGHNTFEQVLNLPQPFGNESRHLRGNIAAAVFPWVMIVLWIFIGLLELLSVGIFTNSCFSAIFWCNK